MVYPMTVRVDGRTARRERNRDEVVEAALALLDEGEADPPLDELTRRSGVSARSIFRYFDGLDDLRRAVIERHYQRIKPLIEVEGAGQGSLEERIRRFVDARVKVSEYVAGPIRTARLRATHSPGLAEDLGRYAQALNDSVKAFFGPELKKRGRAEADDTTALIAVLTSFESWDLLTREHGKSRAQVKRAWALGLTSILGG